MHSTVVVLFFSFGFAFGVPTCDECQDAFGKLTTRLLSEESLAEQMELLKSMSCATLPEPEACNDLVDSWWVVMASILYPNLLDPLDLCTMMMACSASTVRHWTCEDCTNGLTMAADWFESEEVIEQGIELLAGDNFCGQPGATEDCSEQMAVWLPIAMPILAGSVRDQKVELCQEEIGVC